MGLFTLALTTSLMHLQNYFANFFNKLKIVGSNFIHKIKTRMFIGNYIIFTNATALIMIYTNP